MKVADLLKTRGNSTAQVHPAITVQEVAQRLRRENVGAVIVSDDDGSLDGIVTERDVAHGIAAHGTKLLDLPASALATTAAVSCSPNDSVTDVARVMTERDLHHIAVRDGGRLLDVIS
ncbi:MAG: CBS domain-containing protein, partial [Thermomicrobiales bacterium]